MLTDQLVKEAEKLISNAKEFSINKVSNLKYAAILLLVAQHTYTTIQRAHISFYQDDIKKAESINLGVEAILPTKKRRAAA